MDASPSDQPRRRGPFCQRCGHDLGQPLSGSPCSECGAHTGPIDEGGNTMAVIAIVLGILAFVTGCFGIVLAPLAYIFGDRALDAARNGRAPESSAGLAKAGKVCGIVAMWLWTIGVILTGVGLLLLSAFGWP